MVEWDLPFGLIVKHNFKFIIFVIFIILINLLQVWKSTIFNCVHFEYFNKRKKNIASSFGAVEPSA